MSRVVRQRIALFAFLMTPFVLLAVIMWFISVARPEMNAPPVGAGAQSTGGANAIGEYLAHGSAKRRDTVAQVSTGGPVVMVAPESLAQGFVLVVKDEPKLAGPDSPMYMACNLNNWNPADPAWKLSPRPDGRWRIAVAQPANGERLQFRFTRGSAATEERGAGSGAAPSRTLPMLDASMLGAGQQPEVELSVSRWADQRDSGAAAKK